LAVNVFAEDNEEQKLLVSKLDPVLKSLNETFDELVNSLQVQQDTTIPVDKNDMHSEGIECNGF